MIIDIYCHYLSKLVGERVKVDFPVQTADPEVRLRVMQKYDIDMQAISLPPSILNRLGVEDAAEISRLANDDNYVLCKTYPKRFLNICAVSLQDMQSALREIDRSVNELDCRGITVATNQKGKGLDSAEFYPFYEKVIEYDLPIFLHPSNWESYPLVDMQQGWRMMHIFGWPFDTTQAVWRLIFGGILDRYPSLKIITHHLGAMFPFFVRRVEENFNIYLKDSLPRHISKYWANLYGDTALDGTQAAYACGYAFFGPNRMMYGTDYPFGAEAGEDFVRSNLMGVKSMDIPLNEVSKILGLNAKEILKIT